MIIELNEKNLFLYAAQHYYKPQFSDVEEFFEDLKNDSLVRKNKEIEISEILIPGRFLEEVLKEAKEEKEIELYYSEQERVVLFKVALATCCKTPLAEIFNVTASTLLSGFTFNNKSALDPTAVILPSELLSAELI